MRKVEAKTSIKATPEKIISAFTNPKMLHAWWGVERELIELKPGGLYSLAWKITENGLGFIATGIVKEYQADSKLIIENFTYFNPKRSILGPMLLSVETKQNNDFTELYICQDGYREGRDWDWYHEAVLYAWPKTLQIIKDYLETQARRDLEMT